DASAPATPPADTATEPAAPADDATVAPERPSEPESASDAAYWITEELRAEYDALDCTDPANLRGSLSGKPDAAFITCGVDGSGNSDGLKYILGPVEIDGKEIKSASSGLQVLPSGAMG